MEIATNVTAPVGTGVEVFPVTGRRTGPDAVGIKLTIISFARATAVLFMLAKDRSWVLRACKSMAVGGVGSSPANTNTIQAMPPQIISAAKA